MRPQIPDEEKRSEWIEELKRLIVAGSIRYVVYELLKHLFP